MPRARLGVTLALGSLLALTHAYGAYGTSSTRSQSRVRKVLPLSVEVSQRTDVFASPTRKGSYLGTLVRGTRLPVLSEARGGGCRDGRWLEISQGAWMCGAHGRLRWTFPQVTSQPVLAEGKLVPRVAFYARRDGVPVFLTREDALAGRHDRLVEQGFSFTLLSRLNLEGRRFTRTRKGEIVPSEDLYLYHPSSFEGRHLDGVPKETLACSIGYKQTTIRDRPGKDGRRVGSLSHHAWVTVHETTRRGSQRFHRVGDGQWVPAESLRIIHFTPPPPGIRPKERWIEVLLNYQTLVAYEGERPVLATLVSTGRWEHRTPQGIFRARTKVSMSTMANRLGAGELYRVDDVPWIFYFLEGYALHGTYWHDSFGVPKSHGCINLAPRDARWLFTWAPPRLPPGWEAQETHPKLPGVLIRIRNHARAQVEYRGPADQRALSVADTAPP